MKIDTQNLSMDDFLQLSTGKSIPDSWTSVKLEYILDEIKETVPVEQVEQLTPSVVHGVVPQSELENNPQKALRDGYELHPARPGDFVVSLSSHEYGIECCNISGGISPDYTLLRPIIDQSQANFLKWLFKSRPFIELISLLSSDIRQGKRIYWSELKNVEIHLPPEDTASLISKKLNHITNCIDSAIQHKQELIHVTDQRRSAILNEVVSSFIDQRMEDLIGEDTEKSKKKLPRIRYVSSSVTSGPRDWAQYYDDDGEGLFIRITNLHENNIDLKLEDLKRVSPPQNKEAERSRLRPGDVLVSITAEIGAIGIVPTNIPESYVNQHIAVIKSGKQIKSKWLAYYLASPWGQEQLLEPVRGGTKAGLSLTDVSGVRIPIPSLDEQQKAINKIERRVDRTREIGSLTHSSIDILKEKRQALITKTVTGQFDLNNWDFSSKQELSNEI